jgi:hypothetical protein
MSSFQQKKRKHPMAIRKYGPFKERKSINRNFLWNLDVDLTGQRVFFDLM